MQIIINLQAVFWVGTVGTGGLISWRLCKHHTAMAPVSAPATSASKLLFAAYVANTFIFMAVPYIRPIGMRS